MFEQQSTKQDEQNMAYCGSHSQEEYHAILHALIGEVQSLKLLIQEFIDRPKTASLSLNETLWTVEEVAKYLHKSKGTIQSHYQGKAGFPRSKKIGAKRYWKPKEVISYAERG